MVHWGQQLLFLMPVMANFHSWSLFKFLQQDQLCNKFSQSQPLPAATATFLLQHSQYWSSNTKMAHSRSHGRHTQSPKYLQGLLDTVHRDLLFLAMYYLVLHAEAKVMVHMTCTHKQQQQWHCHYCYYGSYMPNSLWGREREAGLCY